MRLSFIGIGLAFGSLLSADTVTLWSGRQLQGTYLGGSAREIRIDIGDQVQTVSLEDIARIEFNPPAATEPRTGPSRGFGNVFGQDVAAALQVGQPAPVELPAGTNLVIRMIDGVDSEVNRLGQTFSASLDQPVLVNGETAIPRGRRRGCQAGRFQ